MGKRHYYLVRLLDRHDSVRDEFVVGVQPHQDLDHKVRSFISMGDRAAVYDGDRVEVDERGMETNLVDVIQK